MGYRVDGKTTIEGVFVCLNDHAGNYTAALFTSFRDYHFRQTAARVGRMLIMPRWEYHVITINTEYEVPFEGEITDSPESNAIIARHLNRMGKDDWELVSFLPAQPMPQKWKGNDFANPWMYHAVFKRPVDE